MGGAEANTERRYAVKASLAGSLDQRAKVPFGSIWLRTEARPSVV